MTHINPKLLAAITTIAAIAPAGVAHADNHSSTGQTRHFERVALAQHHSSDHDRKTSFRFRRDGNSWR
jgi:hypothetical protein